MRELQRRLDVAGLPVRAFSLNPGNVMTDIVQSLPAVASCSAPAQNRERSCAWEMRGAGKGVMRLLPPPLPTISPRAIAPISIFCAPQVKSAYRLLLKAILLSPAEGSRATLYCATSPGAPNNRC